MMKGTSKAEQYIYQILKLRLKKYKVSNGDRKIISPLEIDIVVENKDLKIAIEYNGAVHYKMIYGKTLKSKSKKYISIIKRDLIKEVKLKKLGWKFIIIKDKGSYNEDFLNDAIKKILKLIKELEGDRLDFDKIIIDRDL